MARSRKKTIPRRRKGALAVIVPWAKRFGMVMGVGVFALWAGAWFFLSEADTRASDWVQQAALDVTVSMGFKIDNILVEGRQHSDPDVLRAIINVQKGDPLFSFSPAEAKKLVERIEWVETAHVERRFPDTIYIGIEERRPLALWQKDKKLKLIDEKGEVIRAERLSRFEDLIIVIGKNAPHHAPELLANLSAEPILHKRTAHAHWVGDRRWDLTIDKNITVKLPENDIGLALRRLAMAQDEDGLLDKDIKSLDLREADRIVVRTRPGAVQEYKAGLKTGNNI